MPPTRGISCFSLVLYGIRIRHSFYYNLKLSIFQVEGKIEDGSNQWFFNISGYQSAMDNSQEIFERFQLWDEVLSEDLEIF